MSTNFTSEQVRRGMRLSIYDGVLCQMFYGLTWPSSVFLTGFALLLGASNFEIGLIAAAGPLLSVLFIPSARLLEHFGRIKPYFLWMAGIHRVVFLLVLLIPFTAAFVPPPYQRALLIGIVFVSVLFGVPNNTSWMTWMAEMIPEERRGAFFGRRNMICNGLWMAASYGLGRFVDAHRSTGGYALVFAVGTVLALLALIPASRQPEPELVISEKRPSLPELWKSAWSMVDFRNFLLFQIPWGFAVGLAGPFYNVYMLRNMGVDIAQVTAWGIVGGIIGTITVPYWGMLGDKAGNKPAFLFAIIGSCVTAFGWLFVSPDNASWLMVVIFASSGFFDTGAGLIGLNMIFSVLPKENRSSYYALFETIVAPMYAIAPLVGGFLAIALPAFTLVGHSWDPIFTVIALSTVLRLLPVPLIQAMPSKSQRGVAFLVREFVLANPFRIFSTIHIPQKSADQKIEAIDSLSHTKSKAALPELIESTRDLSPWVRRRAVQALGDIGDAGATDALVGALDDPLGEIRCEAALALGLAGDPRAEEPLLERLDSEDSNLRCCAALALGELSSAKAADHLIAVMESVSAQSLTLAAADALGRIGDRRAVSPLIAASRAPTHSSVKGHLVAAAGLLIDADGRLYKALSRPDRHLHRATAEILNRATVRFARKRGSYFSQGLARALTAFHQKNFNQAIVEMKMLDQLAVHEYLASQEIRTTMPFEAWVHLLDSQYSIQMEAVGRINGPVGAALLIVDYYACHCPSPAEADIDQQELLLSLYAFKNAQAGLYRMVHGGSFLHDRVRSGVAGLSSLLDVE